MRARAALIALSLAAVAAAIMAVQVVAAPAVTRGAASARCPDGTSEDAARSERIARELRAALGRLAHDDDASLLAGAFVGARPALCYGERSELREPDTIVLDRRLGVREAAARTAHLLLHATVAPPWSHAPQEICETRVRRALAAEARALALERRVADALGTRVRAERSQAELAAAYFTRCLQEPR